MDFSVYIMINSGSPDSIWGTMDEETALMEVRTAFLEWFYDGHRHRIQRGDIILATEEDVCTDWRLIRVHYGDSKETVSEVQLPFQEWINEALFQERSEREKEAQEQARKEADPEYQEFLRLQEKFK